MTDSLSNKGRSKSGGEREKLHVMVGGPLAELCHCDERETSDSIVSLAS